MTNLGRQFFRRLFPVSSTQRAAKYVSNSSAHVQPDTKVQPDKRVEQNDAIDTDEYTPKTVSKKGILFDVEVYSTVIDV